MLQENCYRENYSSFPEMQNKLVCANDQKIGWIAEYPYSVDKVLAVPNKDIPYLKSCCFQCVYDVYMQQITPAIDEQVRYVYYAVT